MCDRESTQLLLLARHYLHLAKEALQRVTDKDSTAKDLTKQSKKYVADRSIDPENEVLGHLASGAIRLATIAEKYPKLNLGEDYRKYIKRQQQKAIPEAKKEILGNLPKYIHILFRDNVAHIEDAKMIYADVRKEVIAEISLSSAYSAIEKLLNQIESELLANNIIEERVS